MPRDVHHGDHTGGPKRKVHTADQSFIGSGGKMRRPAKDITSAFRRARHFELKDPARQVHNAEASRAVSAGDSGQHDGGKTTQLSGHGTRAARLDRAHPSRMVEPAPSCVDTVRGANTSAAAQLKARLRGDSIPVVLVETVCIRMFMVSSAFASSLLAASAAVAMTRPWHRHWTAASGVRPDPQLFSV